MMIKIFLFFLFVTFSYSNYCPSNYALVSTSVIGNYTGRDSQTNNVSRDECLAKGFISEDEYIVNSLIDDDTLNISVFTREVKYESYHSGTWSVCDHNITDRKYSCDYKCPEDQIWDSSLDMCVDPITCPDHSTYNASSEACVCETPYYKEFNNSTFSLGNENNFICVLPHCPSFYDDHTPPLPLFKQTDDISKCNFFPYSDSATFEYEDIVCCYGQEDLDHNDTCGTNELEINGECYPITPSDSSEDDNRSCPTGEYYSLIENHCVPFYDNNGTGDSGTGGSGTGDSGTGDSGTGGNGSGGGDTGGSGTGDSFYSQDDALGSLNNALDFDRIQSVVEGAFDSYVLLPLPVTVSGTCSSDFRRTFTIFGHTYVLDLNDYMSSLYDLLPILKAIILFISVYSAIVLVLAGKGD